MMTSVGGEQPSMALNDLRRVTAVLDESIPHPYLVWQDTYFIATPPYRGWQRSEGRLLLHSFLSLDMLWQDTVRPRCEKLPQLNSTIFVNLTAILASDTLS